MKGDFFYSESCDLYISRRPLCIDARVSDAASKNNISLEWDDEGRISSIDFDDSKNILNALGAQMLTPTQYWRCLNDAKKLNDVDMIKELTSDEYAEWLNRVYIDESSFIDNPEIENSKLRGKYVYLGDKILSKAPFARPGWFNPENNIHADTGEPIHVELQREKFSTSWKYWYPNLPTTNLGLTSPIRGYVTSVGKPSLDLGIPCDSRQPKLMIRECRKSPLGTIIDELILSNAQHLIMSGDDLQLLNFLESYGKLFSSSNDVLIHTLREQFFDKLGNMKLNNTDISNLKLSHVYGTNLDYDSFADFIKTSNAALKDALEGKKDVVFVMGHKNPDTDAIVASLFEAWRNHIYANNNTSGNNNNNNGDFANKTIYVPIIQSNRVPDEVKELLGNLSEHVILTTNPLYEKAKSTGLARWISVDQNREPSVQKYFISIIDHHIVSESAKKRAIPKTLEMLGSSAALVSRKYLGMGLNFDRRTASILYGATLMDTENRVEHKMTSLDVKIMDHLKRISNISDDDTMYRNLMSNLLNTDDAELLFQRDYKEDWGFGFGVAKIKNGFTKNGSIIKTALVEHLQNLSTQNTAKKNLPLTLLKITDYENDNEHVNRERVYASFNKNATSAFKKSTMSALESVIRFEFPKDILEIHEDYIEFYGTGMQLSRKKTAPVIEPIVSAFNKYFYSSTIDKFVKRDFLKNTQNIKDVNSNLSFDSDNRINYLTYPDAKKLCNTLGIGMLSLSEYWNVLNDAKILNDVQMMESLQGSNFVEFLDSVILDKEYLIDHPALNENLLDENLSTANLLNSDLIMGNRKKVIVPSGSPGLIHPKDIDLSTGIPMHVRQPNEYGNSQLWRYWAPDSSVVIPCRSFIFLLGQPCWDGKFHMNDSFPNLGMREVVDKIEDPKVSFSWDEKFLKVKINMEKEDHEYNWPKDIKLYAKYGE